MHKFAQSQFELVTQLDPNNVEGWYRLGRSAIENMKAQQAADPLKRAVALAPRDAASHSQLGTAYALQSQFAQAVPEFRRAFELEPENDNYRAAMANAQAMSARTQSEYRDAAALLDRVLKSRPDDEVLEFTLGLLHLRFNNLQDARTRFKHCVAARPTNVEAWYNLSVVELRLGNKPVSEEARKRFQVLTDAQTAISNLEKMVAATPKDPVERVALAKAYAGVGNKLGTYWQLNIARTLAPGDAKIDASYKLAKSRMRPVSHQSEEDGGAAAPGESAGPPPPPELLPKSLAGVAPPGNPQP